MSALGLWPDITVNQHCAFRHYCGQHSLVARFGNLELNQNFFVAILRLPVRSPHARHMREILIAPSGTIREPLTPIDVSTSRQGQYRQATSPTSSLDTHEQWSLSQD